MLLCFYDSTGESGWRAATCPQPAHLPCCQVFATEFKQFILVRSHDALYIRAACLQFFSFPVILQILWAEWSCRSARVNSRNRFQQDVEEYVVNSQQETYWRWRLLSSRVKSKEGGFPTVHTTMAEALVVLHVMVKVEDRTERTGSWTHNQVTK